MSETLAVCTNCGAVNRLPAERPALQAKCPKCGEHLFSGHPADLSGEMLERQIQRGTLPVVVDVWAPWCGPCRAMAPAFAEAARKLEPEVRLVKLNSDNEPALAGRLQIRGIPMMILFQEGHERARVSGAMSAGQIVNWVRGQL